MYFFKWLCYKTTTSSSWFVNSLLAQRIPPNSNFWRECLLGGGGFHPVHPWKGGSLFKYWLCYDKKILRKFPKAGSLKNKSKLGRPISYPPPTLPSHEKNIHINCLYVEKIFILNKEKVHEFIYGPLIIFLRDFSDRLISRSKIKFKP